MWIPDAATKRPFASTATVAIAWSRETAVHRKAVRALGIQQQHGLPDLRQDGWPVLDQHPLDRRR